MSAPRLLVVGEYSGAMRDAFAARGWDAWSCDLEHESETGGRHLVCDGRELLDQGWDLLVAHPPCTDLAVSGARWFPAKRADGRQQAALQLVRDLLAAPVPHIALENPVSIISSAIRKPDQVTQPWWFGHPETKATCWWLVGLPRLTPTYDVSEAMALLTPAQRHRVHRMPPGPDRWRERSRTLPGVAAAAAAQWGAHVEAEFLTSR